MSGLFITVALTYTGGLQGTGDTRSPLFITLVVADRACRSALCFVPAGDRHGCRPSGIWLAIVLGHFTRCVLSAARFHQVDGGTSRLNDE